MNTTTKHLTQMVVNASEIQIVSGEGEGPGTPETFHGVRSVRALKMRLRRERCGGDRWAKALFDGRPCPWRL